MVYEILDELGEVINTINADEQFVQTHYPGRFRLIEQEPVGPSPPRVDPIQEKLDKLTKEMVPAWPVITKYAFRQLLNPTQKLVWDNYDLIKGVLGISDAQFMMMRSFRADFDAAEKVTMDEPLMVQGLNLVVTWGLELDGELVFPQAEVDRILAGQPPAA